MDTSSSSNPSQRTEKAPLARLTNERSLFSRRYSGAQLNKQNPPRKSPLKYPKKAQLHSSSTQQYETTHK
jgi:hypothetical protein